MVVFSRREFGYKLGAIILLVGVVFYITSFSSPYWYRLNTGLVFVNGGLWQICTDFIFIKVCHSTPRGPVASDWMSIVQGLACVAATGLLLACVYGTVVNWLQKNPRYSRLLETFGILSSAVGLVSGVIFIYQVKQNPGYLFSVMTSPRGPLHGLPPLRHAVSWAAGLHLVAGLLSLLGSVLIALFNSPASHHAHEGGPRGGGDAGASAQLPCYAPQEVYYIAGEGGPAVLQAGLGAAAGCQAFGFQTPPPYESVVAAGPPPPPPLYWSHAQAPPHK